MAFVKYWSSISPQAFISDGNFSGTFNLTVTRGFKSNQKVIIEAVGQPVLHGVIKKVLSEITIVVGPSDRDPGSRFDLTNYTVAASATIRANFQSRFDIAEDTRSRAVYEEEPTVAIRTSIVNEFGEKITSTNLPATSKEALDVNIAGGNININNPTINVDLSAFPPDDDSVRIVGIDGTATQKQVRVDSDAYLLIAPPENIIDIGSNEAGDGIVAINKAAETTMLEYSLPAGFLHIASWSWAADKLTQFRLVIEDGGAVTTTIRQGTYSPNNGMESMDFPATRKITGQANRKVKILAQTLQGANGKASAGLNAYIKP